MTLPNIILLAGIFLLACAGDVSGQYCGCDPDVCCDELGYCGTGDDYCGTGCQDGPCYAPPPSNNLSISHLVSDAFFNGIINHAAASCPGRSYYTRAAFLSALDYFRRFARAGSNVNSTRELAAFFAHVTYGTGHFCYVEQIDGAPHDYCDEGNVEHPCVPGKNYYGRGPIQLTWNYNYGPAGQSIGFDGLNAPETVANDPVVGFKTALWFWRKNVVPVIGQGFGATIRAINGELECDGANRAAVRARIGYYVDFCNQLGVSPGGNLIC